MQRIEKFAIRCYARFYSYLCKNLSVLGHLKKTLRDVYEIWNFSKKCKYLDIFANSVISFLYHN